MFLTKKYHSASTKATCIINYAVAPQLKKKHIDCMKINPFSVSVDGSNDVGLSKMNPLTVRMFDFASSKIVTQFLDMCTTSAASAEAIFSVVNGKLTELLDTENPWKLCTSVGVDITSVNIGIHNSLNSRVLQKNPAVYFSGCPCHILHNAAQKAAEAFSCECGFDVEELTIDILV